MLAFVVVAEHVFKVVPSVLARVHVWVPCKDLLTTDRLHREDFEDSLLLAGRVLSLKLRLLILGPTLLVFSSRLGLSLPHVNELLQTVNAQLLVLSWWIDRELINIFLFVTDPVLLVVFELLHGDFTEH
jgi:hypothetical protein